MSGVPLDVRVALLRQYGSFTQAYSATFQPGLEHFGDARGFIAYKPVGRTALILSDPVAPKHEHDRLIREFLDEHADACFWYASHDVAKILSSLGFFINEMGPENRIDLATYDFAGQDKRNVRRSINRIERRGYAIEEAAIDAVGAKAIAAVSDAWRRGHTVRDRELVFISRPMVIAEELDVRTLFVFDRDRRLVAFSVFDPIYELGQVVGYTAQQNRQLPEADSLVQHAIKRRAIELFRSEGRKWLFLGVSPLAEINDWEFPHNWLVHRAFAFAYKSALFNRFVYPAKSLSEHKFQFRGVTHQTYYAFNKLPSLPRLLKLLRACDIF
jgi:lysylphosphatidylglycerol synthetase-like protein (DUF2156 family)